MKKDDTKKSIQPNSSVASHVTDDANAQDIDDRDSQIIEWKQKYLRAIADYQNLEKRTRDQRIEERKYSAEIVLERLLPVLDTLGRAQEHVKDQGIDLAIKEFWKVLTEQGVQKIDVMGKIFDPHEMECIEVVDGEDQKVVAEVLPGYRLFDKVLRVAQVNVGKKNINEVLPA